MHLLKLFNKLSNEELVLNHDQQPTHSVREIFSSLLVGPRPNSRYVRSSLSLSRTGHRATTWFDVSFWSLYSVCGVRCCMFIKQKRSKCEIYASGISIVRDAC